MSKDRFSSFFLLFLMNNLLCEGGLNGSVSQRTWGADRVGCRVEPSGDCQEKQSISTAILKYRLIQEWISGFPRLLKM